MANRPTSRKRYYTNNSTGVKRSEKTLLQSLQAPVPRQKPVDQHRVNKKAALLSARTNRNAPVQALRPTYYRKKKV